MSVAGLQSDGGPAARKANGRFDTPPHLVDYILRETLRPLVRRAARQVRQLAVRPGTRPEQLLEPYRALKILDPAVGGGVFLARAAVYLSAALARDPRLPGPRDYARRQAHFQQLVIGSCLYGVDVDPQAVRQTRKRLAAPAQVCCGDSLSATFAWERQFPEVFDGRGGFDAVIGNPPFVHVRTGLIAPEAARSLRQRWALARGQWDLFALFTECALQLLRPGGRWAFVLPRRALANENFAAWRQLVFEQNCPEAVLDVGQAFPEAGVECVVVTATKTAPAPQVCLRVEALSPTGVVVQGKLPVATLRYMPFGIVPLRHPPRAVALAARLARQGTPLGELADITRGIEAGRNDSRISRTPGSGAFPLLRGEDVGRFRLAHAGWYVTPDPARPAKYKAPAVYAPPKLLVRFVAAGLIAAYDAVGYHTTNVLYCLHARCDLWALCALLNSRLLDGWFRLTFQGDEALFPHVQKSQLARVPIVLGNRRQQRRLAELARRLQTLNQARPAPVAAKALQEEQEEMDRLVCRLYGVQPEEIAALWCPSEHAQVEGMARPRLAGPGHAVLLDRRQPAAATVRSAGYCSFFSVKRNA